MCSPHLLFQVVDNAITIMFAGHDTSSSIMVRMFDLLVRHPGVMDKVRGQGGRRVKGRRLGGGGGGGGGEGNGKKVV